MEIEENEILSDEEVSEEAHKKLLSAVGQLYKKQRIDAPKRREPAQEISEYNLSAGAEGNAKVVSVNELLGDLKERATHQEITKKVRIAQRKAKKLPKPLEKIQEQKITRQIGYDNVRNVLNRWNSTVERNRLASQLSFPLEQKKVKMTAQYDFLKTFKEPTELEKEMAKVLNQSQIAIEERKEEKNLSKLSVEEMIERRNMTAKMRARESYRIAKAIRQNKIKSKKYHRILKKERIKQELKDFEKLQKTDPEAALEKLEQIERARAEERISLRHRNTGKWARSRAIRAKYDTEARIQLAEQLAKSRDLTQKLKANENSGSENETEEDCSENEDVCNTNAAKLENNSSLENPWVSEYQKFLSGYVRFSGKKSSDVNGNKDKENPITEDISKNNSENNTESISHNTPPVQITIVTNNNDIKSISNEDNSKGENSVSSDAGGDAISEGEEVLEIDENSNDFSDSTIATKTNSKQKDCSINEIFEEVEEVLQNHTKAVADKLKQDLNGVKDVDEEEDEVNGEEINKSDFKTSTKLRDIDSALIEVAADGISSGQNDLSELKEKLNLSEQKAEKEPRVDPNIHINVKPQKLSSEIPDLDENGDDTDDEERQKNLNLMEAFAEDDIADQFREEKKEEEKSTKACAIDLEMPGWGSWGGSNITNNPKKRRRRRLKLVFPSVPRKDEKKPNVIINEDPVPKLRQQLVNELPYPFTSVKDFEASIRAPLGKQWVTEKGFKKLTAPEVITKLGTIIEPISNAQLVDKPTVNKRLSDSKSKPDVKRKKRK